MQACRWLQLGQHHLMNMWSRIMRLACQMQALQVSLWGVCVRTWLMPLMLCWGMKGEKCMLSCRINIAAGLACTRGCGLCLW